MLDGQDKIVGVGHGSATLAQKSELMKQAISKIAVAMNKESIDIYGGQIPFVFVGLLPVDNGTQEVTTWANIDRNSACSICAMAASAWTPTQSPAPPDVPEVDASPEAPVTP